MRSADFRGVARKIKNNNGRPPNRLNDLGSADENGSGW